ncbi:MAG: cadmium-translocating P-type ATPase [Chlamydiales bacterium]|nr:cadmium-translocating P-type ATPase [Chlamydiales bacterium]
MSLRNLFPATSGGVELFDEFFESGLEESVSPFLTPESRRWGKNVGLKSSLTSAFLLLAAYICSFVPGQQPLSNLFLLLTFFLAGIPALISSVEDLFNLEINIDVLMTLAAFLSVLIGSGKEGALLLVLFSFSGAMETAVRTKAKGAISSLKNLAPQRAYVVQPDGSLTARSVKDIIPGTHIHVKAGEVVPLDGRVVSGSSSVNLVHLTGENLPLTRDVGDTVPAGGRNLEGAFTLEVTHTSSDSTLARIIQLITQAQEAKPKLQRWLDSLSNRYAMTIIALAFLFAAALPWIFPMPYLGTEGSVYRALAFLIAASPCALIIAIPIAYLSAVSCCAKQGILLKGGVILDALAKCRTVAMDKTGTLTTGELVCLEMIVEKDYETFLSIAYALEQSAVHPIAQAITNYAESKGILPAPITDFRSLPGYGLEGEFEGKEVRIGNADWLMPETDQLREIKERGEIVTVLRVGEEYAIFRFRDQLRRDIIPTLHKLKEKWGMRLLMLTGDHEASARAIAKEAGLTEYYAELRPEDKLAYISKEENLAMVGDGINDAPALARATVGISMGKVGSTTAIDASDIVFLQDSIDLLEWLVKKSHEVVRIVKQNVSIALAAIVFATMPALLGWIPLWLAVVLHEGGTVLVGLNALRLLRKR